MNLKKAILWLFLSCVGLAMLTGIAAAVLPSGWVDEEVMITILLVGCYSLGGLIVVVLGGIRGHDGRRQRWTLGISTAALLISMALFITMVWVSWRIDQHFMKSAAISLTVGITFVHRLVMLPLRSELTIFRVCKYTALITGALTGSIVVAAFLTEGFGFYDELMFRILAISAIFTAGSTIAAGALAFFAPRAGENEQGILASSVPLEFTCPRCQTEIHALSNKESRCGKCKLKVRVEIQEPRCLCGYLLYQLDSDACPECGRAIDTSEQWGIAESTTVSSAEQSASGDPDQTRSS
ncbi:MAG: hypothetical protein AB8C13_07240 [Phycisphaerales bacterium]